MKKRLMHLLLVLVMFSVYSYIAAAECLDNDGDGYGISYGAGAGCTGEDCNDNDYYINPSRSEICGNGVDDDCDGVIDEGDCCSDFDKDEYGDPASDTCASSELDCDNTNPNINPGKPENTFAPCTDGLDNNCNGLIDQDDQGCAEFYPTPTGEGLTGTGSLGGAAAGAGGGPSCPLSSPVWVNTDIDAITEASVGQDIILLVIADSCKGEEVEFSIHKKGGTGAIEEGVGTIEKDNQGNLFAAYITTAPQETGEYFFKATSTSEAVTSDTLKVASAAEKECRIEWDCSAVDYGACVGGKKKREVCPGYEGAQCCSDEASCACAAIYPEEECDMYTYATPQSERTCAEVAFKEEEKELAWEEPEEEEAEPGFPWMLVAGIIIISLLVIGGIAYLIIAKKPAAAVPASLLNYVKAAKAKKVPDSAIQEALLKSGWKPEQIKAALKKAK